ncbi:MAG: hypothetical protein FWE14_01120 [Lachnospiraceae bacterium]|nr:hypothetical protein [Lachnospiraceae bacterium]
MKKIIISFLLILILAFAACANSEASLTMQELETRQELEKEIEANIAAFEMTRIVGAFGMSSRVCYFTVEDLLESYWKTDLVVIGEFIEEAETTLQYQYNEFFDKEVVVDAHANGRFLIKEVLWGDAKAGDIVTIYQRYAFDYEYNELISFSETMPMHKGDRWIYFLSSMGNNRFFITGDSDGRYPLPNDDIKKVMDIFSKESLDIYKINSEDVQSEKVRSEYDNAWHQALKKIDASVLGVYNRYDFNFALYAEIIDFFNIETRDWVNPYQRLDAKIISIYDTQDQ